MYKQKYLSVLMHLPSPYITPLPNNEVIEWIKHSMNNPSPYMRPIHIKLHLIALRKMGVQL